MTAHAGMEKQVKKRRVEAANSRSLTACFPFRKHIFPTETSYPSLPIASASLFLGSALK
jgi:hypothetical protein